MELVPFLALFGILCIEASLFELGIHDIIHLACNRVVEVVRGHAEKFGLRRKF